jgi:hypothetical protein
MRKQIEKAVAQMVADASHRGFHGSATLVLSIQDGTIQNVRVAVERLIK